MSKHKSFLSTSKTKMLFCKCLIVLGVKTWKFIKTNLNFAFIITQQTKSFHKQPANNL